MALDVNLIPQLRQRAVPICADGDMAFREPWEAKAFAIVVTLSGEGYFTWSEWVERFSEHVARATADEASGKMPKTYYEQWVDAAEELLIEKGVTSREQIFAKRLSAFQASVGHSNSVKPPLRDEAIQ
ncbi:nitrile hydratase accessory protein [Caballeronia sp. INSB1]|uniref:nitrile hydratase accessory protein n=1 Tax=Caballeronia sp. INSB1 TaxID=2921751 RepID=UPI0020324B5B|nr:nitrile hydratase accessory protein [Caballeronia sp. INSB1]